MPRITGCLFIFQCIVFNVVTNNSVNIILGRPGLPYISPAARGGTTAAVGAQETVDRLFGVGRAKVVDTITSTKVTEHEVILVNGTPVQLVGPDGEALKRALIEGRLPDQSVLNRVLSSVLGSELKGVAKVESNVTMSSKVTTKDTLTVHHNGKLVDERIAESKYDTILQGNINDAFKISDSHQSIFSSACTTPSSSPIPPVRASRKPSTTSKKSSSRTSSRSSRSPSTASKSSSSNIPHERTTCSSPVLPLRSNRTSTSSGTSGVGSSSGCSSNGSPPVSSLMMLTSPEFNDVTPDSVSPSLKGLGVLSLLSTTPLSLSKVTNILPPPSPLVESLKKLDMKRKEEESQNGTYVKLHRIPNVSKSHC